MYVYDTEFKRNVSGTKDKMLSSVWVWYWFLESLLGISVKNLDVQTWNYRFSPLIVCKWSYCGTLYIFM